MKAKQWLWQRTGWLATPPLGAKLMARAQMLESRAQKIARRASPETANILLAHALAEELQASWAIEREPLDAAALRAAILPYLSADVRAWRQKIPPRSLAARAAILAISLNIASLSPKKIRKLHETMPPDRDYENIPTHWIWGKFRADAVYVASGTKIVYEAPPASDVHALMQQFCQWWNTERPKLPAPLAAALAHMFFVVIHPFEDGNGRMARLLMLWALAGCQRLPLPYAVSHAIFAALSQYYGALDTLAEKGGIERFMEFLLRCISDELKAAEQRMVELHSVQGLCAHAAATGDPLTPVEHAISLEMALIRKPHAHTLWHSCDTWRAITNPGDEDVAAAHDRVLAREAAMAQNSAS